MKKAIIACLLATSAASAFAEWTKFEETADGTSFYIDYKTIRKDVNLRMVWGVTDLKQRHKNGEMSRRVRYQFDCREEKVTVLALSTHSEGMTAGNMLTSYTYSTPEWSHIPPGSALESNLKIVCAK